MLFQLKDGELGIAGVAIGLVISLELSALGNGTSAIGTLEAKLVVGVSVEGEQFHRVDSLAAGEALRVRGLEHVLDGGGLLAHHTIGVFLLTTVVLLGAVFGLVETSTIELFVALGAERIVVVIAVITTSNNVVAVQTLETELVIHSAESAETFGEENALITSRTDRVVSGSVKDNLLDLSFSVRSDLSADEVGTFEFIDLGGITSDGKNTDADLSEVLQLVQIASAEKIHFRTANTSGKGNESTDILSFEENRTLVDLLIKTN